MIGTLGYLNLGGVSHFKIELTCSLRRTYLDLFFRFPFKSAHVFEELSKGWNLSNRLKKRKIDLNLLKGLWDIISLLVLLEGNGASKA